eukprot:g8630.t1
MWRILIASVLLFVTLKVCSAQENATSSEGFLEEKIPLEILRTEPSELLTETSFRVFSLRRFTVVFSRPVIPLGSDFGSEELSSATVPFTLSPSIAGRGRWITMYIYRFSIEGSFPTDLDIMFRWNLGLRTFDGVPLTLNTSDTIILQTPELTMRIFTVTSATANEVSDNSWSGFVGTRRDILPEVPPDGNITVFFSAPVSLEMVQDNLKVRDRSRDRDTDIRPIVSTCVSTRRVRINPSTCANVTLVGTLEMGIRYELILEAGVEYGPASGPLRRSISDDFGGLRDFYIPFRDNQEFFIRTPFLRFYLPHGLEVGTKLDDIPISITANSTGLPIKFNLTQLSKSVFLISAPLMPLENYTFTVQASDAIRDGFGLPLNTSVAILRCSRIINRFFQVSKPLVPNYLIFEANENWGRIAVTLTKGRGMSDNAMCDNGSALNVWSINQPESGILLFSGTSHNSFEQVLGPPSASLISSIMNPIASLSTLNLVPFLQDSGVVATQYCISNRFRRAIFTQTYFQAVVVTNSRRDESDHEITIWVTSMVTGKPIEGANAFLLQYQRSSLQSPELLGEGRTDTNGIAKISISESGSSLVVVIRVGSKFLYIPDVHVRNAFRSTYDDSIILDRVLVHPGETLHVKGFVMERNGTDFIPIRGVNNTRLIISPSLAGNSAYPVELNQEFGSYEARITVPEDVDLARYRIRFSTDFEERARRFNGETAFFTVENPRTPTTQLVTDTPFFVRPDEDIEFSIQITSLISLSVRRFDVTVEWRISDSNRDSEAEPLQGELVITTDDDGNGTAIIELSQFEVPPSLGSTAVLEFRLVTPIYEVIEDSAQIRIDVANLCVSLKRTVDTDIPGQSFGAELEVTDLRGDPLTADNSVGSATISLIRIPPDSGRIRTRSTQPYNGEVVASCDFVVDSGEYCDFVIPEIGEFLLEGCVQQGDVQLCRSATIGETAEFWDRTPLHQFLTMGFVDLTNKALHIGDTKRILVENPYFGAYILISWGTIQRVEQEVKPLEHGRPTVEVQVPEFCEFDCRLSLVIAIPRQTKGLATNMQVPVSLLFDTAMPHIVTYSASIEVIPNDPTDISVDISFPEARTDDDTPVVGPGESTSIEIEVDQEGRTEITVFAVDRAVLDLVPYPLQNITLDFLTNLATSFGVSNINRNLVPPQAIQVLINNFLARREIDPWFSLIHELNDYTPVDRSSEEYIDFRSQSITISTLRATETQLSRPQDSTSTTGSSSASIGDQCPYSFTTRVPFLIVERSARLESEFQTTPLFVTEVAEGGIIRVNFTAPANLGTFTVRAYAATGTGIFGSAESEIIVRREVSLTPSVPRFARVDDIFEAGAVVTASGSTIVPISLTAEIDGPLEFLGSSSQIVEVGGDGQEEARFLLRATMVGMANFTLVADDGQGNTDALQIEIPIEGLQESVTVGTSFVIQGDDTGAFTEGLELPAAVPGSGDIAITAGVGRQPAVLAIANLVLNTNRDFLCTIIADLVVASAALPGIVNPYSPWNPDPEIISPALVEQINSIVPRFEDAVELLAVGGDFTSNRLGLRYSVPCPERFFTPSSPSISQNTRGVFVVNLAEENLRNHELEEVQATAATLFEARDVWRGVLEEELVSTAIRSRRRGVVISLSTVAEAFAALGPDWTPDTTDELIMDDLSLSRLSSNFSRMSIESQAYYILTRLAQTNGSTHPDVPMALERWTNLLRVTGRTAYVSAFSGATYPASNLANTLVFLAFTRAGQEGQLIPRLGSYIAAPASDRYGFTFYGSYSQVITMQALVEFDVSRGSAQPNLQFEARTGNITILEANFTDSTPPVASATILWEDLPPRPEPIEVSAMGEGEAFVSITLNFIPAEILPFPSYRGIYVQRSIQLEDGEQGDGPGLSVVPQGTVVSIKVQFLTPDALDETIVRVLMPAGLEPIDPNISPSSSRFCPIPFFRFFRSFYGSCPTQETRPSVVTITYRTVRPGTSSVTFRAVAATVGTYTLPPIRVFVSDQLQSAFNIHGLISKVRKGSLAPLPSQYSADWCHLIRSMLKKTPTKRPSIQDLINAPCMREALTKAIKRAKNINKCFCYTKVRSETPIYWKSHFVSYCSEESPDSEEESNAISDTQKRSENRQSTNKSSKLRRQKSDESTENKTEISRQPELMKCNSNSPTEDEHAPIQEESSSSTSDIQQSNSITTPPCLEEESISKPDCNSASSIPSPDEGVTVTSLMEQTEEQCDEETQNQRTSYDTLKQARNERIEECVFDANAAISSRRVEPLPCKVEVVDVNKLDLDAEASDSYTSRSQWSSPSHMSAFIDGRRGDGLEAIPEDSCEGSTCPLWNSLPNSTLGVSSNPSPSLYPVQELQRTLSGVSDARASSSLRDDSPFATDPRMSPSVSGSPCIDNQKRLDTVEQILTLCCSLYNKGRWHELGHILTHVPKLMNLQGRHTSEKSSKLTVCPGDKVLVGASKPRHAIVRYYGPVAFSRGDWVGLELDAPVGKTDGNISGIPYFSCPKDRGLFVKASMFSKNEVKKPVKVLP